MKKGITVTLIVAAVLFVVGGSLCVISLAGVGWNLKALSTEEPLRSRSVSYPLQETTSIVIEDRNNDIIIKETQGDQVIVTCWENNNKSYNIFLADGQLEIKYQDPQEWFHFFTFGFWDDRTLVVEIPSGYRGSIEADTSNGSVEAAGLSTEANLYLETSNAKIQLKNVHTTGKAALKTTNGKITLENVSAEKKLTADTSNADIEVKAISAPGIFLDTSNGDIEGTILGSLNDYTISSHTSNGSNNLPASYNAGPGELSVTTSNADIEILFR